MTAKKLDGTVVLVTGASSGIGEATLKAFANEGAAVAAVARRKDRLDQLVHEINSKGGNAIAIEADITVQAQAIHAVEQTVKEFGRLDTLINNAGVMLLGPVFDAPVEEWERMISVNQLGLLYMTHAGLPHLIRAAEDSPRGVADLINVSSYAGRKATLNHGVYNMTKFGVNGFSDSLRQELSEKHVRVSLIEPGPVRTELPDHIRPEVRQVTRPIFAEMEWLQPEDIAEAAVFIVTRPRRAAVNEILILPSEMGSR